MPYVRNLCILFFFIVSNFTYAEDEIEIYKIALDLCSNHDTADQGFIYVKTLLEKYKSDECQDFLKELMTLCLVSERYFEEAAKNADDVIKTSKDFTFIGFAWFQKARFASVNNDDHGAVNYAIISLKFLEKCDDKYISEDGKVSTLMLVKCLCHNIKSFAYMNLGDKEKEKEEKDIVDSILKSWKEKEDEQAKAASTNFLGSNSQKAADLPKL